MVNSHILIPKVILKHFALQGGSLFYYDIKSGEVKRGYAATLNTQKGYYSSEVEKFLSANIESPMGKIIGILQKAYNDLFKTKKVEMTFYAQNIKVLKNYVYSLITRSPIMVEQVATNLIFREWFTEQNIRDMSFYDGYNIAVREDFLHQFGLTFRFGEVGNEFAMPMRGCCTYLYGQTECYFIPLTSHIAALFYNGKDIYPNIAIESEERVNRLNDMSLEQQINSGFGFIASPNKQIIEKLLERYKDNAADEK